MTGKRRLLGACWGVLALWSCEDSAQGRGPETDAASADAVAADVRLADAAGADARRPGPDGTPPASDAAPPDASLADVRLEPDGPLPDVRPPADARLADAAPGLDAQRPDAVPAPDAALPDAVPGPDAALPDAAPGADRALPDGAPEADAALPDTAVPDAALPDAAPDPDAAPPPAPALPAELTAPCRGGESVSVFGVTAFAGPAGLYLALSRAADPAVVQPFAPFAADERPVGLAARPSAVGAAFFLAVQGLADCRLEARSLSGDVIWSEVLPAATCHRPLLAGERLYVPVDRGGDAVLEIRSPDDGGARPGLSFPGQDWGAAPVRAGDLGMLAATRGALHLFDLGADPPLVTASLETPELEPSALALLDAASLVVTGRTAPDVLGVGDAFLRVQVDAAAFRLATLGPPVLFPGPSLASPVGGNDCIDQLANGGSHWWCPGGVVAAGGDGWMRAWRFDDATELFAHSPLDLRVTGVTLARDGRIMNGGSHWMPGRSEYRVEAVRPGQGGAIQVQEMVRGEAPPEACVGSPAIESDGLFTFAALSVAPDAVLVRQGSPLGGLAPAWSRGATGDLLGTGAPVDLQAPCPGGTLSLGQRLVDAGLNAQARFVVPTDDGGVLLAGERLILDGDAWIGGYDAAGAPRFLTNIPGDVQDPASLAGLSARPGSVLAALPTGEAATPQVRLVGLDALGAVRFDRLEPFLDGLLPSDVQPIPASFAHGMLADRFGAVLPEPTHTIATFDDDGNYLNERFVTPPVPAFLRRFVATDTGFWVIGATRAEADARAMVLLTDVEGTVQVSDLAGAPGASLNAVDLALEPDGRLAVLGSTTAGANPTESWLRFYAADGTFESQVPLAVRRPTALTRTLEGYAVAYSDLHVSRLDRFGAFIDEAAYGDRTGQDVQGSTDIAVQGNGALVVAGFRQPAGQGGFSTFVAYADAWGHASCAEAGACAPVAADACAPRGACEAGSCDPATGQCLFQQFANGAPCGSNLTCQAGRCQ